MTWPILQVQSTSKNDIELLCMIGSGGICYENQKRQWCNRIYGYGLRRKLYSIIRTYRSRYGVLWKSGKTMMWHILQVRPTLKRKLSCRDRSNQLRTIMKTKPDSEMTDHKGAVNVEIKIELSWPIRPSANFYEKKIGQWSDWSYIWGLCWKQNWHIMTDRAKCDLWRKPNKKMIWSIV